MHSGRANDCNHPSRATEAIDTRMVFRSKCHQAGRENRRGSLRFCRAMTRPDRRQRQGRIPDMVTIQVNNLIDFVAEVFSRSESSPEEARRIATYLTTANLTGHDSHGVIRVPLYVSWKKAGSVVPDQIAEVVVDMPSL